MGKIVLTQGSFDVFHAGHVNFLERCAKFGELYVGLLTDESYSNYRNHPPINTWDYRAKVLVGTKYVEKVFPTTPTSMREDIEKYIPDVIAIGTDWITKDIYKQWGVTPKMIDDKLIYIPYTQGISSTDVKNKIKKA